MKCWKFLVCALLQIGGTITSLQAGVLCWTLNDDLCCCSHSWSGLYIGVRGGYDYTRSIHDDLTNVPLFNHLKHISNGGDVGIHLGYQIQSDNNLVYSIETAFDTISGKHTKHLLGPVGTPFEGSTITTRSKQEWIYSLTPRLGYAFCKFLLYAKAGFSLSRFKHHVDVSSVNPAVQVDFLRATKSVGATFGFGLEYYWRPHWIVGLECNFFDFRRKFYGSNDHSRNELQRIKVHPQNGTFLVRLSYKF